MNLFPKLHNVWTSSTSPVTFIELLVPADNVGSRRYAILLHTEYGETWEATV